MLEGTQDWRRMIERRETFLASLPHAASVLAVKADVGRRDDRDFDRLDPFQALRLADTAFALGDVETGLRWATKAVDSDLSHTDPDLLCLAVVVGEFKIMIRSSGLHSLPRRDGRFVFGELWQWPEPGRERTRLFVAAIAARFAQGTRLTPLNAFGRRDRKHLFSPVEITSIAYSPTHLAAYPRGVGEFAAEQTRSNAIAALEIDWARRVAMLRSDRTSWSRAWPRARVFDWGLMSILIGMVRRGIEPETSPLNADVQHLRNMAREIAYTLPSELSV